jgi:pimeloyl-ACP methyl ester carboxylesterase/DNA-binding CsgD family transcriptional regulator
LHVTPDTRYAKSGDLNIAFQVVGEGPPDLVAVPGFVSHVEAGWQWPYLSRYLHRLATFSRLVVFDKRGTGLSDPVTGDVRFEERVDDIRAVMDECGLERAHLLGTSEGGAMSIAFATTYPDRVRSLVLYGSYARRVQAPGHPWGATPEELEFFRSSFDEAWATGTWWDILHPERETDAATRDAWARYLRVSASPGMAKMLLAQNAQIDVRSLLARVDAPTLVIHRTDDRWIQVGSGRYLAEQIPGATFVELEGSDHRPWLDDADAVLDAIQAFIAPEAVRPRSGSAAMGVDALSRREREVVDLAVAGESTAHIAAHLFLSERTIETHLANAYVKLGVHSRFELVRRAGELGL